MIVLNLAFHFLNLSIAFLIYFLATATFRDEKKYQERNTKARLANLDRNFLNLSKN